MQGRLEGDTRKFKRGGRIRELLKEKERGGVGEKEEEGERNREGIYMYGADGKKEILNN